MRFLVRSSVMLLLLSCYQSQSSRAVPVRDREHWDKEASSNMTLLSYSNATATSWENSDSANMMDPRSTSRSAELLPSATETPIPPISPTPSSQYDSSTNFHFVSTSGEIAMNAPSNDVAPDPTDHCTLLSVLDIFILLVNTNVSVLFTLSDCNSAVCSSCVYGVRLAKWNADATSGNTVDEMKLRWGGWMTEFVPEMYNSQMPFKTVFTGVTLNEAYYAQVAIGREEDFIDGVPAPTSSAISNVRFLGTQVPMTLTASKSITVYEGEPLLLVCEAEGIPKPTVVLHKVIEYKGPNDQGDSTSYISNAGREHAGTYLCVATQYSFGVDSSQPIPKSIVQLSTFSVTVLATSSVSSTGSISSSMYSHTTISSTPAHMTTSSSALPTPSPTVSCRELPWRVCTAHRLSQGQVVSHGRVESGPSMTTVVAAVAQLEMTDAHPQECMDALKQLLCLSHFSPCEGGNQTAPGRRACSPDCTELFTGRCQDLWKAYLNTVVEGSAAYKDHIEGCAVETNGQDCFLLFASSETPTETPKPSTPAPADAVVTVMAVLLAVIMLVVVVVAVCTVFVFVRRSRRLSVSFLKPWDKDSTPLALPYVFNEDYYKSKYGFVPHSRLLNISRDNIELHEVIGEGHFGTVHKATIKNLEGGAIPRVVAVKTLKLGTSGEGVKEFLQEARFMSHLDHPNIVRLYAISMNQEPFELIFEYMEGGDLKEFVQRRAGSMERRLIFPDMYLNRNDSTSSTDPPALSASELINICYQIACGMEHIASRGQVHRDLAARNCLVGQNMVVKIGDFGLSRSLYSNPYIREKSGADLPVRWIAPESLLTGQFRLHSDVWSFGVLMWEVFTFGHLPYYGRGNEEIVNLVCSGNTLDCPYNCSGSVYAIMKSCWQLDPEQRPTFPQLVATLQDYEAQSHEEELPTPSFLSEIEEGLEDDVFTDDEFDRRLQDDGSVEERSVRDDEGDKEQDNVKGREYVNISEAHFSVKV